MKKIDQYLSQGMTLHPSEFDTTPLTTKDAMDLDTQDLSQRVDKAFSMTDRKAAFLILDKLQEDIEQRVLGVWPDRFTQRLVSKKREIGMIQDRILREMEKRSEEKGEEKEEEVKQVQRGTWSNAQVCLAQADFDPELRSNEEGAPNVTLASAIVRAHLGLLTRNEETEMGNAVIVSGFLLSIDPKDDRVSGLIGSTRTSEHSFSLLKDIFHLRKRHAGMIVQIQNEERMAILMELEKRRKKNQMMVVLSEYRREFSTRKSYYIPGMVIDVDKGCATLEHQEISPGRIILKDDVEQKIIKMIRKNSAEIITMSTEGDSLPDYLQIGSVRDGEKRKR